MRQISLKSLVLAGFLAVAASTFGLDADLPLSRQQVPEDSRVDAARTAVRELYKVEFGRRSVGARLALSGRLLKEGSKTGDLATEYVMYEQAHELALTAGDFPKAVLALKSLEKRFVIDPQILHDMSVQTMLFTAGKVRHPADVLAVIDVGVVLIEKSLENRHFNDAWDMARILRSVHPTITNPGYRGYASGKLERYRNLELAFRRCRPALHKLEQDPQDPLANRLAGRFYCLELGQWERGLPMLACSDDVLLKAVAIREMEPPTGAEGRAALGDAWFELAGQSSRRNEPKLLDRATYWYRLAEPQLKGVRKLEVAGHLEDLEPSDIAANVLDELTPEHRRNLIRHENKYLLFVNKIMTHHQAEDWCKSHGATLVRIDSHAENELLVDHARGVRRAFKYFWTSGSDVGHPGKWRWSDGSPLRFNRWPDSTPTDAKGNRRYLRVHRSQAWDHWRPTTKHVFYAQWVVKE